MTWANEPTDDQLVQYLTEFADEIDAHGTFTPQSYTMRNAAYAIKRLRSLNTELVAALDAAEGAIRLGDIANLSKVAFVWAQRRDHILAGDETWADQRVEPPQWDARPRHPVRPWRDADASDAAS